MTRRDFLEHSAATVGSLAVLPTSSSAAEPKIFFKIALGEYSFNSLYRAGKYNPLELASLARKKFQLGAIDYVSTFWADKAHDKTFLAELKKRASDNDITSHIILVDLPGPQLGNPDSSSRAAAVEAHRFWLGVAQFLDCRGIRVNLNGFGRSGDKQAALSFAVDGYSKLLQHGEHDNLDILVQNHIGYTCDPDWLVAVMKQVNNKHAGIEADPGHFQELFLLPKAGGGYDMQNGESFDLYAGWAKLMPFTKTANAKTHNFDADGNETTIDYRHLLAIMKNVGFRGYIGIEWEPEGTGTQLTSSEGINKTKALLEKDGASLS